MRSFKRLNDIRDLLYVLHSMFFPSSTFHLPLAVAGSTKSGANTLARASHFPGCSPSSTLSCSSLLFPQTCHSHPRRVELRCWCNGVAVTKDIQHDLSSYAVTWIRAQCVGDRSTCEGLQERTPDYMWGSLNRVRTGSRGPRGGMPDLVRKFRPLRRARRDFLSGHPDPYPGKG